MIVNNTMKEGQYKMIEVELLEKVVRVKNIHYTFHTKMREYLIDNELESDFYDDYFPESMDLLKEYANIMEQFKPQEKK